MLNRDNGLMIVSQFGSVHETTISVVRNLCLHFRADIPVSNPLHAGFFFQDENQEETWVQFKIERLSDYYYKCELLDYVTG